MNRLRCFENLLVSSIRLSSTSSQPCASQSYRTDGALSSRVLHRQQIKRPKLVIFDKDGTLICFHTMWTPWAVRTAQRLERETGKEVEDHVYDLLGMCPKEQKVKPGLLAEGTMDQIGHSLLSLLSSRSVPKSLASELVDDCMRDSYQRSAVHLQEIHDLQELFYRLKAANMKIAVCTADNRNSTVQVLRQTGVMDLVDITMCGDDVGSLPKPDPRNALTICEQLEVEPTDAVMVGDTLADLQMASSAGLGAGIGVLSGVGRREHLEDYATVLVNHIGELHDLFEEEQD